MLFHGRSFYVETHQDNSTQFIQDLEKERRQKGLPKLAQIEIEGACNYDCLFCINNGSKKYNENRKMSQNHLNNIFVQLEQLGIQHVTISGGEPFLRDDICEILEQTLDFGFGVTIFSNGSLISEKHLDVLKQIRLTDLRITHYGNREVYKKFTRRGNYDTFMKSIKKISSSGIPYSLAFVLTNMHKESLTEYEALAKHNNKSVYHYTVLNSYSGKNSDANERLQLCSDDPIFGRIPIKKEETGADRLSDECIIGKDAICIDCEGYVYPCTMYPFPIGDTYEQSLEDIWLNNEENERLKEINRTRRTPECKSCLYRNFCTKCMAYSIGFTGDFNIPAKLSCTQAKFQYEVNMKWGTSE